MRIEAAFLASHAEVHGGMFYVHGAYATQILIPELPFTRGLQFGLVIELTDDEVEDSFTMVPLKLRLRDADGIVLKEADAEFWADTEKLERNITEIANDPAPNFMTYPIVMEGEFQSEGLHLLEVVHFNEVLHTVRFGIVVAEG